MGNQDEFFQNEIVACITSPMQHRKHQQTRCVLLSVPLGVRGITNPPGATASSSNIPLGSRSLGQLPRRLYLPCGEPWPCPSLPGQRDVPCPLPAPPILAQAPVQSIPAGLPWAATRERARTAASLPPWRAAGTAPPVSPQLNLTDLAIRAGIVLQSA